MSIEFHSDESMHNQRNKNATFLIFESAKLASVMNKSEISCFFCFLRFKSFLIFLFILKIMSKINMSSLLNIQIILKFNSKNKKNDLSQRKFWLTFDPIKLRFIFLFRWFVFLGHDWKLNLNLWLQWLF